MNSAISYFLLSLIKKVSLPLVIVTDDEEKAGSIAENFYSLQGFFSANNKKEILFFSPVEQERILSLYKLASQSFPLIIITKDSLLQEIYPQQKFLSLCRSLEVGEELGYSLLLEILYRNGFNRVENVAEPGEFSVRGEIVDFWTPQEENPHRLAFDRDVVEKITVFDPFTQRSINPIDKVNLIPVNAGAGGHLDSYLPADTSFYLIDIEELPGFYQSFSIAGSWGKDNYRFEAVLGWNNNFLAFVKNLRSWTEDGFRCIIFCHNQGEKERLSELLSENAAEAKEISFALGDIDSSFIFLEERLVVVASDDIFNRHRVRRYWPKFKGGGSIESLEELSVRDYVVHERYGIARYLGLERIKVDGKPGDFLTLEFKGGDRLYVPVTDFRLVQKYLGPEGHIPKLSALDISQWERTKARVRQAIEAMAKELLHTQALRQERPGFVYPSDSHYEQEFAESFLYEETPDQAKAIAEVKSDLQSPRPMDRLVCGDVGYGKTEVAMRAALKTVLAGRQVVMLVPTTILAEQHYQNFRERFAEYPVVVEMLSRFKSKKETKKILTDLTAGTVDIIIGTHRLLQSDVRLRDLGLVIIDEEHRFGVAQKEKLKKLRATVDVLILTATPIPRTLSMGLGGIREMSVIETPPIGRLPIATWVGPYEEKIVKNAILAEVYRGGQVFYVHNRIETILSRLAQLKKLLPEVRFAVIHGQLPAKQIEETMEKFLHNDYDVLLATTIIESGLDIPQVNTLLIDEAEDFGLAQLYQLRGRIGRGRRRAYCYLFYSAGQSLSEEARKRLKALQEFASLGSGFRLALRDLEIRGAGNILGAQQHGFMAEIGYDLYYRLLAQEIKTMKGEKAEETVEPEIALNVAAYWPEEYITASSSRILFYKKLLSVKNTTELEDIKTELSDRYGPLPDVARDLFSIGEIRLLAQKLKIEKIEESNGHLFLVFSPAAVLSEEIILKLPRVYPTLKFIPGEKFQLSLALPAEEKMLDFVKNFLSNLR